MRCFAMKVVLGIVPLAACILVRAGDLQPASRDIGREVLSVFSDKCAACHGPDVPKPRGRFGYVLDLRRIRENPEMVIPGQPQESELLELVRRGEMPPADSPRGRLTLKQKEIVRAWIAAGAPDPVEVPVVGPTNPGPKGSDSQSAPPPLPSTGANRAIRWLGKFHLLLLHFPIALAMAGGLAEIWGRIFRRPSTSARYCITLAALAAVPTAALGWLHAAAGNGVSEPEILALHRWLGTSAAVCLAITALVQHWETHRQRRSWWAAVLLAASVLLTGLAAHFGGLLTHGPEFFTY